MRPNSSQHSFALLILSLAIAALALASVGILVVSNLVGHELIISFSAGEIARHIIIALMLGGGTLAISALSRK